MVAGAEGDNQWDQVGTVVARGVLTNEGEFVAEQVSGGQRVYRVQGLVDQSQVFDIPFERVLGLSWLFQMIGEQVNVAKTIGKVMRVRWEKGGGFEVEIRISGNAVGEIEVEEGEDEDGEEVSAAEEA